MSSVINLASDSPVLPEFPSSGICILESRHKHGFVMQPSSYDFSEVMLILEGKGFVTSGKVRHPVRRHDIITVAEKTPYFYEDDAAAPLAMLCLCLRPENEYKNILEPIIPRKFQVLRNANLSREVSSHLRAIFFEQSQSRRWSSAIIVGQVLLMLSKIARRVELGAKDDEQPSSNEIEAVVRVRDYIAKLDSNFHEAETIESAASRLKLSPRTLTHHFRRIAGVSRLQYILQLRLQHARYLLRESNESVTSIAFACGFDDLSNFFRIFRQHEKVSPSQWREVHGLKVPPPERRPKGGKT
jgi:AraC-like DNA-binding protein